MSSNSIEFQLLNSNLGSYTPLLLSAPLGIANISQTPGFRGLKEPSVALAKYYRGFLAATYRMLILSQMIHFKSYFNKT